MKIGYFVPEFPGQTHNFFWRELSELSKLGVEGQLVSTRLPPPGIISPSWSTEAIKNTTYLFPISKKESLKLIGQFLCKGPVKWIKCLSIALKADQLSSVEKLKLLLFIPFALKLSEIARQQHWTHVHVHSCANALNIALFAHILTGITYSQTLHNPIAVYGGNQKQKWKYSSFGIVITQKIMHEINVGLKGFLPPVVRLAPMGCDVEKFKRNIPYQPYTENSVLKIFSCARLNPAKGFLDLFQSVATLKSQGLNVTLKVAGEDDQGGNGYRKKLENAIAELGLQDNITLLGSSSEESIINELQQSHVFVLASLAEPLGVAIMEAMSMELPTIATNAGGVPELIEHMHDGVLVSPQNPPELAHAILNIANNKALAKNLSANARQKILDQFQSTRSAKEIAASLGQMNHQSYLSSI